MIYKALFAVSALLVAHLAYAQAVDPVLNNIDSLPKTENNSGFDKFMKKGERLFKIWALAAVRSMHSILILQKLFSEIKVMGHTSSSREEVKIIHEFDILR
ncbi:MAG: hypothetical protein QM763_10120 [Agriterribacter sp.]